MKHLKKIGGFLISLLFLYIALRKVDFEKVPQILASARLEFAFLMLFTMSAEHLSRGFRWRVLLGRPGQPYFPFLCGWIFGMFFNNIFPARAGEFARSVYLSKKCGVPASEAFGSVVLERFLDGVIILSFISISFSLFPVPGILRTAALSAVTFYFLVCLALVIMQFRLSWFDSILSILLYPFPQNIKTKVHSIKDSFVKGFALIRRPRQLFQALLISLGNWVISVVTIWLGLRTFSPEFGFSEALLLISVVSIGMMIPASPGNFGVFEVCFVLTLDGVLHLGNEFAVTVGLFLHLCSYFFILLVGSVLLFYENISIKDLEEEPEPAKVS